MKMVATIPQSKSVLNPLLKKTTDLLGEEFEGLVSTVRQYESHDCGWWQLIPVIFKEEIEANYFPF